MRLKKSWARTLAVFLLGASLFAACESRPPDVTRQIVAFGTLVELQVYGSEAKQIDAVLARLEARYREIDRDWYPWERAGRRGDGELRRINSALAAGRAIDVSPALAQLIRRAAAIESASHGKFNPAIGRLTQLWGFDDVLRERWQPPAAVDIHKLVSEHPGSEQLQWHAHSLSSTSTATLIDLGGIAKGAILELTLSLLSAGGVRNAIINIGGDLSVLGTVHGRAARIGIRSPVADKPVAWLGIAAGETVVTSGNYERFFEYQGRKYQHILDPGTGFPVQHTASVTVIHRDPVLADAAATALVVAGSDEFDETCAALNIKWAILIDAGGETRLTADMAKRVNWVE